MAKLEYTSNSSQTEELNPLLRPSKNQENLQP